MRKWVLTVCTLCYLSPLYGQTGTSIWGIGVVGEMQRFKSVNLTNVQSFINYGLTSTRSLSEHTFLDFSALYSYRFYRENRRKVITDYDIINGTTTNYYSTVEEHLLILDLGLNYELLPGKAPLLIRGGIRIERPLVDGDRSFVHSDGRSEILHAIDRIIDKRILALNIGLGTGIDYEELSTMYIYATYSHYFKTNYPIYGYPSSESKNGQVGILTLSARWLFNL